jgi:hypothetical protein
LDLSSPGNDHTDGGVAPSQVFIEPEEKLMFAVLALICFVIALLDVSLGDLNLVTLGLAFVAAHLAFGIPFEPRKWRRRR